MQGTVQSDVPDLARKVDRREHRSCAWSNLPVFVSFVLASIAICTLSTAAQQKAALKGQPLTAEFWRAADEALTAMDSANDVALEPDSTFKPLAARADALASKLNRLARNAREREVSRAMDEYSAGIVHRRFEWFYGKDPAEQQTPDWSKARKAIIAALKK